MPDKKIEYKYNPRLPFAGDQRQGNATINGRFYNDSIAVKQPFGVIFRWMFSRNPQHAEKKREDWSLRMVPLKVLPESGDSIVWFGHSTFLIRIGDKRIITDPVFGNIPFYKRNAALPCDITLLKDIDYVLLSHDHRDHLSIGSIRKLYSPNPGITALTPLGMDRLFDRDSMRRMNLQEAAWYQRYDISDGMRITFLPARHWGRRSLWDYNKTLCGSFLIESGGKSIYFAGDTAYGSHFKEIASTMGNPDVCLMPIGAYRPEYVMRPHHMNPQEAIEAFGDLGGKILIPMHYGTFDLSDEPLGEPIHLLRNTAGEKGVRDRIKELAVGEVFDI